MATAADVQSGAAAEIVETGGAGSTSARGVTGSGKLLPVADKIDDPNFGAGAAAAGGGAGTVAAGSSMQLGGAEMYGDEWQSSAGPAQQHNSAPAAAAAAAATASAIAAPVAVAAQVAEAEPADDLTAQEGGG